MLYQHLIQKKIKILEIIILEVSLKNTESPDKPPFYNQNHQVMKIFRKARSQFIEKGQTSKYMKYAIGEILLVVIGILIALQINNWNEADKEDRVLKEYLAKIRSHTQEDLRELDTLILYRTQMTNTCKAARKVMLTKKEDENIYIMMASGIAFADFFFKAKTDGYEALKNSNSFGKINNTVLDSLLIQYHGLVEGIAENEKSYNDYILTQETYISARFDRTLVLAAAFMKPDSLAKLKIPPSEFTNTFQEYISSPAYRNAISLAAFQFDLMVKQYKELVQTGNAVIEEIDTFIDP